MILVSSHLDRVVQDYNLGYAQGQHSGLLDNFAGVLLTYLVLYDDHNLRRFEAEGKLQIWHGKGEEWGRLDGAPRLIKKDTVIVVDVCCGSQYKKYDFGVENISGFKKKDVTAIKDHLEWEGMKPRVRAYDGNPDDEDEAWEWRKRGIKVVSFIIPIQAKWTGWHRVQQDNTVDAEVMTTCRQGLKRLIAYFIC
jgi:hypothetical protein